MKFQTSADYPATPDKVFAVMSDPSFQQEKVAQTSEKGGTSSVTTSGESTVIHTERSFTTRSLPDFARRLVGEELVIIEDQTWDAPSADGSRTGRMKLHLAGQPVTVTGALSLRPNGSGSVSSLDGELKARIPFIGGKVESAAAPLLKEGAAAEGRLIAERL